MPLYDRVLMEKLALATRDHNQKREIELIRSYQMSPSVLTLQLLQREFEGIIEACVQRATASLGDHAARKGIAIEAFEEAVRAYDPNKRVNGKPIKPSTYIMGHITNKMNHALNRGDGTGATRMGESDMIGARAINNAENLLSLEGRPLTVDAIANEINRTPSTRSKSGFKSITAEKIERNRALQRQSLSGNAVISFESAEPLRQEDVNNVDDEDGMDMMRGEWYKEKLEQRMKLLTPLERNVLADKEGIDGHKTEQSWTMIALNNNLQSAYFAKKVYEAAVKKLKGEV